MTNNKKILLLITLTIVFIIIAICFYRSVEQDIMFNRIIDSQNSEEQPQEFLTIDEPRYETNTGVSDFLTLN